MYASTVSDDTTLGNKMGEAVCDTFQKYLVLFGGHLYIHAPLSTVPFKPVLVRVTQREGGPG